MIIGGLGLFVISDYIIPTSEEPAGPVLPDTPKPEKRRPVPETPVAETPTAETPVAKTPTAETPVAETPTAETPVTETPAAETPVAETPAAETPVAETPTTETPVDSPVDVTSTETPTDPVTTPDTETVDTSEQPKIDLNPTSSTDTEDNSGTGESTTPGDENLTDQILQDLEKQVKVAPPKEQKKEYVAPPDYEYRGRGLVYNCAGKHWACVDAPSYKSCEDNSSSVKYLKKKTECYPFNVYETPKGCENVQNRMVSSSSKTEFCND